MRIQRTGFRTSAIPYIGVLLICVGIPNSTAMAASYSTNFPKAEPVISENGHWVTAGSPGVDWHDTLAGFKGVLHVSSVSTTPGFAFGPSGAKPFGDSLAVLTGTWSPDQEASATVLQVKPVGYPEVEIRLRTSPKDATGYEIMWSALGKEKKPYLAIATWDGPGSKSPHYTILKTLSGPEYGVATGDVVKARIVWMISQRGARGVAKAELSCEADSENYPRRLLRDICITSDWMFTRSRSAIA